jgi:hypothetical protein
MPHKIGPYLWIKQVYYSTWILVPQTVYTSSLNLVILNNTINELDWVGFAFSLLLIFKLLHSLLPIPN